MWYFQIMMYYCICLSLRICWHTYILIHDVTVTMTIAKIEIAAQEECRSLSYALVQP